MHHIQAVLDRLAPEPTTARNLRWSSVFRISHRIVDAYRRGRVFAQRYSPAGPAAYLVRPDGYLGFCAAGDFSSGGLDELVPHLRAIFG